MSSLEGGRVIFDSVNPPRRRVTISHVMNGLRMGGRVYRSVFLNLRRSLGLRQGVDFVVKVLQEVVQDLQILLVGISLLPCLSAPSTGVGQDLEIV